MLRFFVTTRLFSSSSSRPAAPRAPLFRIALPPCNLLFANEGEMIDHLKTNPPISFPVFVGSNIFFGAHGSRLGLDVEIDIIFANNELEEKLLAVEVKHVSTHAQRFKQRRKSKGQAIIASQLCAETFGKSSLGGVFSSESPHEISIWSEFVMHTPRLCKEHNLIEVKGKREWVYFSK